MENGKHTAFLFATHKLTMPIIEQYYRLQDATRHLGDLYLLIEDGDTEDIPNNILFYSFSVDKLNELEYEPIADTIIPGSNHFPVLLFHKDHSEYDYYWNIEYDVYFNGDWNCLFSAYELADTDFVTSHIAHYCDLPSWMWWSSMQLTTLSIPQAEFIRSFNPIYRISNRALKRLDEVLRQQNAGHHEVLIPTVLYHSGYTLGDFGYFHSLGIDDNDANCSMRFRPVYDRMEIERKGIDNLLYHPVK